MIGGVMPGGGGGVTTGGATTGAVATAVVAAELEVVPVLTAVETAGEPCACATAFVVTVVPVD
jgi:hypothetical protein